VQQNLAYHLLDNDTNITYYEANQDAAYALLRSGKIMDIVNSRFGNTAKDLVQNLLQLGHAKIGDVVDAYEMNKSAAKLHNKGHANGNGTSNGTNGNHELEKLDEVLSRLLESGLVEPVVGSMFRSPTDTYNIAEKKLIKENFGGSIKGAKQKDELKRMLAEHLRELRSEGRGWDASRGIKRTANGDHVNGSEKRRKLTNGHGLVNGDSNGNSDDTFGLDVGTSSSD
jgi:DNA-directed RNA polymerase III subunit RPC3